MSDPIFEAINHTTTEIFTGFCFSNRLTPIVMGIDKHGAYVWETGGHINGLNRYLTLAIRTSAKVSPKDSSFNPEITFPVVSSIIYGIDDGTRFYSDESEAVGRVSVDEYNFYAKNKLGTDLKHAWMIALGTTENELKERYILRRPSEQEQRTGTHQPV